jgi:hypothetical protein
VTGGLFSSLRRAVQNAVGGGADSAAPKEAKRASAGDFDVDGSDGEDDPFAGSALAAPDPDPDAPASSAAELSAAANPEAVAAAAAASRLDAAREHLRDLERERELLARQKGYDFGPDDAWRPLAGECAETAAGHFTYRVCLFDAAHQVDGAGHETSLGAWGGIVEEGPAGSGGEAAAAAAVFSGGDPCGADGPRRSLRARLACGAEFAVSDASEPETCVYAATVTAPQACTPEGLARLEAAVRDLDAEQARLAAEIAADEAERRAEARGGGGAVAAAPSPAAAAAASSHDEL